MFGGARVQGPAIVPPPAPTLTSGLGSRVRLCSHERLENYIITQRFRRNRNRNWNDISAISFHVLMIVAHLK